MTTPDSGESTQRVREHCRLLSIFYFIAAGMHLAGVAVLVLQLAVMQFTFGELERDLAESNERRTTVQVRSPDAKSRFGDEEETHQRSRREIEARLDASHSSHDDIFEIFDVFIWIIGAAMVFIVLSAAMYVATGVAFRRRRGWTLALVGSAWACFWMPVGTVLGVFAIITLVKPEARALFGLPAYRSRLR